MAFTLAFPDNAVPPIPDHSGRPRIPDRHEHFGTEEAALARAAVLIGGDQWFDLRLYGPDGRQIADRHGLRDRIAGRVPSSRDSLRDPIRDPGGNGSENGGGKGAGTAARVDASGVPAGSGQEEGP